MLTTGSRSRSTSNEWLMDHSLALVEERTSCAIVFWTRASSGKAFLSKLFLFTKSCSLLCTGDVSPLVAASSFDRYGKRYNTNTCQGDVQPHAPHMPGHR